MSASEVLGTIEDGSMTVTRLTGGTILVEEDGDSMFFTAAGVAALAALVDGTRS